MERAMIPTLELTPQAILDGIHDGVYVTDTERTILYWGKGAERITGWSAAQVVGTRCQDRILCHTDTEGRPLCGEGNCPLYRCMRTGKGSRSPMIVFAQTRAGGRIPLQVSVQPLRDGDGQVIGGVETFRDLSAEYADLRRAHAIQLHSLPRELPGDPRIRFASRFTPCDIIGGDFYAVARLDADRYGLFLADITGHGVPAALYTMFLKSLWDHYQLRMEEPAWFAQTISERLRNLTLEDEPFAAALCALFDLRKCELRIVAAGNPPPLIMRATGGWETPDIRGLPLGLEEATSFEEAVIGLHSGDGVLFFTDGAIEVSDATGDRPGLAGLRRILEEMRYADAPAPALTALEERLLGASDRIRFDDDMTFVDVRIA
jgi:sigma-B regulation protein RsbU (phosphoserine phosphatase)